MKRLLLLYGVGGGALVFLTSYTPAAIIGSRFDQATPAEFAAAEWLGYLRYLLLALGILLAMRSYRAAGMGPGTYGSTFVVGVLIALIIAFFVGVMEYVYLAYTNPDFYAQYYNLAAEEMRRAGASEAALAAARRGAEQYRWLENPWATGAYYFIETLVIGTVLSAIAAIFMRRKAGGITGGSAVQVGNTAA